MVWGCQDSKNNHNSKSSLAAGELVEDSSMLVCRPNGELKECSAKIRRHPSRMETTAGSTSSMANDATREHLSLSQRPQNSSFVFISDGAQKVFGQGILCIQPHSPWNAYIITFLPDVIPQASTSLTSEMPSEKLSNSSDHGSMAWKIQQERKWLAICQVYKMTFPLTLYFSLITGPGRQEICVSHPHRVIVLQFWRWYVHIQTLHLFSAMHWISKTSLHRGRKIILGQLAPLTPRVISSCLAPISVLKPAFLSLRALLIPCTATKSLNLASKSHINCMNNHPNRFEVSLHLLQGKIHFWCFIHNFTFPV